jgi:hypothetical protein
MDLTQTIVPKSDQINAEDVMATGPITVTVESVSRGNAEQPVDIHLVEYPGRAYRPSKTMRRVLVKAWGAESDTYAGHRMTLYYDAEVKFGGTKVGGIKISHVSHITKRLDLALTETRGKRVVHTVQPLTEAARPAAQPKVATPNLDDITDIAALRAMWNADDPALCEAITARVAELKTLTAPADEWPDVAVPE